MGKVDLSFADEKEIEYIESLNLESLTGYKINELNKRFNKYRVDKKHKIYFIEYSLSNKDSAKSNVIDFYSIPIKRFVCYRENIIIWNKHIIKIVYEEESWQDGLSITLHGIFAPSCLKTEEEDLRRMIKEIFESTEKFLIKNPALYFDYYDKSKFIYC